jgi:hypothetical protein
MKKAFALFTLPFSFALFYAASCSSHPPLSGVPPTFSYSAIAGNRIAYARPVVVSSEIFYENRFTDQSYHSIDKERTKEAFFRDMRQKIGHAGLSWRQIGETDDSMTQQCLSSVKNPLDSLPAALVAGLRGEGVDIAVFVYAVRLYHQQSIGLRPDKTGSVNSYTSIIIKSLDLICSIMDINANRPVFYIAMKKTVNDNSLDFMEKAIDDLFKVILR